MNEEIEPVFNEGWNNCAHELGILIEDAFLDPPKDKPLFEHIKEIIKNHIIDDKKEDHDPETLPPIIKDALVMDVSSQVSVTLFPEPEGQPDIDIIKLSLKQLEGNLSTLFLTPCEAIEISQALMNTVQFYLYNQEQYREEILEKRLKLSKLRSDKVNYNPPVSNSMSTLEIPISYRNSDIERAIVNICTHFSIPYEIEEDKERKIILGDHE